jgi:hypothetical protein
MPAERTLLRIRVASMTARTWVTGEVTSAGFFGGGRPDLVAVAVQVLTSPDTDSRTYAPAIAYRVGGGKRRARPILSPFCVHGFIACTVASGTPKYLAMLNRLSPDRMTYR